LKVWNCSGKRGDKSGQKKLKKAEIQVVPVCGETELNGGWAAKAEMIPAKGANDK
jgi:hypothetical protein